MVNGYGASSLTWLPLRFSQVKLLLSIYTKFKTCLAHNETVEKAIINNDTHFSMKSPAFF